MAEELQLEAKTRISRNPEILATNLEEETVKRVYQRLELSYGRAASSSRRPRKRK